MKTVILSRPVSEHARTVDEFVHEFSRRYPDRRLELVNIDSREGSAMAKSYDITRYPAILVLQDNGSSMMVWQDENLPLLDEVISYLH